MKKRLLTGVAMVGSALLIVSAAALFLVSGEMSIGIMESFRFPEFLEIYIWMAGLGTMLLLTSLVCLFLQRKRHPETVQPMTKRDFILKICILAAAQLGLIIVLFHAVLSWGFAQITASLMGYWHPGREIGLFFANWMKSIWITLLGAAFLIAAFCLLAVGRKKQKTEAVILESSGIWSLCTVVAVGRRYALVHFDDAKKHSKVARSRLPSGVSVGDRLEWDQNTFTQLL